MRKLIALILILAALVTGGIGVAQEHKQKPKLPPHLETQAKQKAMQDALQKLAGKGERVNKGVEAQAYRDCTCIGKGNCTCCVCNVGGAVGHGCACSAPD